MSRQQEWPLSLAPSSYQGEAQEATFLPPASPVPCCFYSAVWLGSGPTRHVSLLMGQAREEGLPRVPYEGEGSFYVEPEAQMKALMSMGWGGAEKDKVGERGTTSLLPP